ncbi:hypothetical protein ACP3TI_13420, partial [Desulforudis sp. 1190]|uniref:hypothetical protein n=1 Tax=Desulforudis sp. 1190 TaxID=3416136 RepID=UPI003CFA286F
MEGLISAVLSYDTSPDTTLSSTPTRSGNASVTSVVAGPGAGEVVAEGFEAADQWIRVAGTASTARGATQTEGAASLEMSYDVSGGNAEIGRSSSLVPFAEGSYSAVKLDMKGDGSYNTVYLKVLDATGELFLYRVDAMRSTSWATLTIDFTKAPASATAGNGNGVLDSPIALQRVVVARNGSQPATGKLLLDNLRTVSDGWDIVRAERDRFTPSAGQTEPITVAAGTGDYQIALKDPAGRTRTFTGTSSTPGTITHPWDGKDSAGTTMEGLISAVLSYDTSPDTTLSSTPTRSGNASVT